jgi:hypothetical protein
MALSELDQLLVIPKRVQATLIQNRLRREQGSYDPQFVRIAISRHAKDPLGTFLHEFGHFLDNRVLHPLYRDYASRYDLDFRPLMDVCLNSAPIVEMAEILQFRRRYLSPKDTLVLRDACEPQEIFARAFAQWACCKSTNPMLLASLQRRIEGKLPFGRKLITFQWDQTTFADIIIELDRLFGKKGLL